METGGTGYTGLCGYSRGAHGWLEDAWVERAGRLLERAGHLLGRAEY